MLFAEIKQDVSKYCSDDCNRELVFGVCKSAAGYYLGYWCSYCGPYDRVSGYFETADLAIEYYTSMMTCLETSKN